MSPFWRALLVGLVLVAFVLLAQGYGRIPRGLANAAWRASQSVRGLSDVRGIGWLMALGASLVSAVVLLAILITALPTTGSGAPATAREAARGSASRSTNEPPHPPQELPRDSARFALPRTEVRENRQREQRVDQ
jgi:hypothetical protein